MYVEAIRPVEHTGEDRGLGPGGFITVRVREGKLGKDFMEGKKKIVIE